MIMRHKIAILAISAFTVAGLYAYAKSDLRGAIIGKADPSAYSISLTADDPMTGLNGETKTVHGVIFFYGYNSFVSGYHVAFLAEGGVINDDTTPITSILSLTPVFDGEIVIFTKKAASDEPTPYLGTINSGDIVAFSDNPYYFGLFAKTETKLTSLTITYSCIPTALL